VNQFTPRNVLVTGGAGFIGCNFVAHLLADPAIQRVVTLDLLTYAGRRENLDPVSGDPRHQFVHGDIRDETLVKRLFRTHDIDTVVHFAAESHVDRSITGPAPFIDTNVVGTFVLLEVTRAQWLEERKWDGARCRFHQISTDEVYGSLGPDDPPFTEETPYAPNSPYAASKAAADHLVRAYGNTYGLPVVTTNCSNNYGPYQHPEKFVPTVIRSCLAAEPIPVYGDGGYVRDWLYVTDHCRGIEAALRGGAPGSTYVIGGRAERRNLEIVTAISQALAEVTGRPAEEFWRLTTFVADRLGHDRRYAINPAKIERELGWKPRETFETGIRRTVKWYYARSGAQPLSKRRVSAT
jgi:dTDP-glucose 4,6-dehydratase